MPGSSSENIELLPIPRLSGVVEHDNSLGPNQPEESEMSNNATTGEILYIMGNKAVATVNNVPVRQAVSFANSFKVSKPRDSDDHAFGRLRSDGSEKGFLDMRHSTSRIHLPRLTTELGTWDTKNAKYFAELYVSVVGSDFIVLTTSGAYPKRLTLLVLDFLGLGTDPRIRWRRCLRSGRALD